MALKEAPISEDGERDQQHYLPIWHIPIRNSFGCAKPSSSLWTLRTGSLASPANNSAPSLVDFCTATSMIFQRCLLT